MKVISLAERGPDLVRMNTLAMTLYINSRDQGQSPESIASRLDMDAGRFEARYQAILTMRRSQTCA